MKINLWDFCFKKAINLGSFGTNGCTIFFPPSLNSFIFFCFTAIHLFSTHYVVVRKYFCQYLLSRECFYSLNLTLTASSSWCFVVLRFLLCVKMDKSRFNFIRESFILILFYFCCCCCQTRWTCGVWWNEMHTLSMYCFFWSGGNCFYTCLMFCLDVLRRYKFKIRFGFHPKLETLAG